MKTIGLVGGMSWESTIPYYEIINSAVKERLGGLHSAKCLLYSVDFAELETCLRTGDWDKICEILSDAGKRLARAGADMLVICTNTMHKVAPQIEKNVGLPLLHIADATCDALLADGLHTVALLGTSYTMEQDFYRERLTRRGLDVRVPDAADRRMINDVIFNELCLGVLRPESADAFLRVIDEMAKRGCEGVILGCTEIGMLINQNRTPVKLYDTTRIHALRAAQLALAEA